MKKNVIFLSFLVLMCSCLKDHPKKIYPALYGVEHNPVRDNLGITLLDSNWVAFSTWEVGTAWGPKEKQPYPYHTTKQMGYFNDTLYCELDSYTNGEQYETEDGLETVLLRVMYFYRSSRSGPLGGLTYGDDVIGWYCVYESGLGIHSHISKAEADSILELWGIKN